MLSHLQPLRHLSVVLTAALLLALAACTPVHQGAPVDPAPGPGSGQLADYSFGHTAVVAEHFTDGPLNAVQRLPFTLAADATSFRVHLRNWNYLTDQPVPGTLELSGLWIGAQGAEKDVAAFADEPTRITREATLSDGETFTTPWIADDDVALTAGRPMLLSMGLRADHGIALSATGGVSWIDTFGASELGGVPEAIGDLNVGTAFLDVWIEYTTAPTTPVLFTIGHSLNTPGNVHPDLQPHDGEVTSWPQQWALSSGGAAATLAVPGAWTTSFGPDSLKWRTYGDATPDYVTFWASSSDLDSGRPVADVQLSMQVLVAHARSLWPQARVIAFTEPPRGSDAKTDAARAEYNRWLRTKPLELDAVVDADRILVDPADPHSLRPEITADGSHLNPAGHRLVAGMLRATIAALDPR